MTTLTSAEQPRREPLAVPLLADLIGFALFWLLSGFLAARFSRSAVDMTALADAGLLAGFHMLFVIGVVLVRKLAPVRDAKLNWLNNRAPIGILAVLYAIAFAFSIADLSGYLTTLFTVDFGDMGNGYYFLVTPAIYLFVGLLYLFVLTQPISAEAQHPTGFISLLLINMMLIATAAYLRTNLSLVLESEGQLAIAVIIYIILAALFLLPRLIYAAKTRNWFSLASFDVLLMALAIVSVLS